MLFLEKRASSGASSIHFSFNVFKNEIILKPSNEKYSAKDVKSAIDEYSNQLQFMIDNGLDNQTFVTSFPSRA